MASHLSFDESGWLFSNPQSNATHDISHDDLWRLWELASDEDARVEEAKREAHEVERSIAAGETGGGADWILQEMRVRQLSGTVVHFPYGRAITFPSKRHFFRGESKQYSRTVPSLNRMLDALKSGRDRERMRVVAFMRKWRFAKTLMRIRHVPLWMATLSDVNFDALAQHYGLPTHLLDLTNDFKTALFFATCTYDRGTGAYRPLTWEDIDQDARSRYGCLFHSPNWELDWLNAGPSLSWMGRSGGTEPHKPQALQSGDLDGIAFQIGYQPLQRCDFQASYVYPMRNLPPLQEDWRFEKLRFEQTPELSRSVYDAMEGGTKVFPEEGVAELDDVFASIKACTRFSIDELEAAYECDAPDKTLYPTVGVLRADLVGFRTSDGEVDVVDEVIEEEVPTSVLDAVNERYAGIDPIGRVGGEVRMKPYDRVYFDRRFADLFGELS